jgi:predicted nucleotidyltransferase
VGCFRDCAVRALVGATAGTLATMRTMQSARLDAAERRALGRAAELLERELGEELLAVWFYGSRARDERPREDSDVDLFVVVRERGSLEKRVRELVSRAAEEAGAEPFAFQAFVYDLRRLAEETGIHSLFLREVERDRIVLAGGELPPLPTCRSMSERRCMGRAGDDPLALLALDGSGLPGRGGALPRARRRQRRAGEHRLLRDALRGAGGPPRGAPRRTEARRHVAADARAVRREQGGSRRRSWRGLRRWRATAWPRTTTGRPSAPRRARPTSGRAAIRRADRPADRGRAPGRRRRLNGARSGSPPAPRRASPPCARGSGPTPG